MAKKNISKKPIKQKPIKNTQISSKEPVIPAKQENKYIKHINTRIKYILLGFVIVMLVFASYLLLTQGSNIPGNQPLDEQDELISDLMRIALIPTDETPEIATIYNVEDYSEILFFSRAQNGDKVIGFLKAKFAILYRPTTKQIIWMGPLTSANNNNISPTPPETP